jgi:hypothetical protein
MDYRELFLQLSQSFLFSIDEGEICMGLRGDENIFYIYFFNAFWGGNFTIKLDVLHDFDQLLAVLDDSGQFFSLSTILT